MKLGHSQLTVLILFALTATALSQLQVMTYTRLEQYQQCMERFKLFQRTLLNIRKECPAPLPHSCCQLKGTFFSARSGVYEIKDVCSVGNSKAFGSCDMDTDGGGWLVIQRRINGTLLFNRTFTEYENGFGDPSGEFWYGLKNIHCFTQNEATELRIDLEYPNGNTGYVHYKHFRISGARSYTANATVFKTSPGMKSDFFNPQRKIHFYYRLKSTQLYQPDFYVNANCGRSNPRVGGWWDTSCRGNPNGPGPSENSTVYAMWNGEVVTKTEIKIRQKNCIINPAFRCQDYYKQY